MCIGRCVRAFENGRMPESADAAFFFGGISAWLQLGGDLCRDFWKVTAPSGSHHTPSFIWSRSSAGATEANDEGSIDESTDDDGDDK
jgi:hypothetical protein